MNIKTIFILAACIIVCELVGFLGSFFTISQIPTWYATLQKSSLNPPGWVFGPVWTMLYALMGIALFFIIKNGWGMREIKIAVFIFIIQLVLNAIWSPIFFGMHNPTLALVDIIVLWIFVVFTMFLFFKISPVAGWLLVPYILWITFALYLNYAVVSMN